jgi:hypothetical protein
MLGIVCVSRFIAVTFSYLFEFIRQTVDGTAFNYFAISCHGASMAEVSLIEPFWYFDQRFSILSFL